MSTHTTHIESRKRNERFAEFIRSEEMQQQMKNMSKSKCLQFLREQFKQKYNETMPASAAYKVIATVDERFKPKQRAVTNKSSGEIISESIEEIMNENPEVNEFINHIQRIRNQTEE